jgi:hypothetical protein
VDEPALWENLLAVSNLANQMPPDVTLVVCLFFPVSICYNGWWTGAPMLVGLLQLGLGFRGEKQSPTEA